MRREMRREEGSASLGVDTFGRRESGGRRGAEGARERNDLMTCNPTPVGLL